MNDENLIIRLNDDYDDSNEPKVDRAYLNKIYDMMREQAENPIDEGDTWKVTAYRTRSFDKTDEIVAEMFFNRRDGVTDRNSAIKYMIKQFNLPEDCKLEATKL